MSNRVIVMDIGAYSSKVGFAGEDTPSLEFFTRVGKPKYQDLDKKFMKLDQEIYVGDEIQSVGLYKIFRPVQNGKIVDWDYFKKIIDYSFYNLRVDPTLVNVLFSIQPLFPTEDLKRLFRLFLEEIQCRAFYPLLDTTLVLYSGGFQTGLVVELGESSTRIVPMYNGFQLNHAVEVLEIGGSVLTKYMGEVVEDTTGFSPDSSIRREIMRALKEKACFVSLDYKEDLRRSEQYKKEYYLPDGSTISLSKERFVVPELIFSPKSSYEFSPLHIAILDVIERCDVDLRPELLNKIFLSGGSSMFPNLKSRLYQELELELARREKENQFVKIIAPRERTNSVWIGGSILALLPEFSERWITRASYFRNGIPKHLL
ncbi:MAG: Actin-related protein [Promethearchaeota archaeon]|nr:MAG: Actin-related protein [Candidatus Lokiarchaeota archaeon]